MEWTGVWPCILFSYLYSYPLDNTNPHSLIYIQIRSIDRPAQIWDTRYGNSHFSVLPRDGHGQLISAAFPFPAQVGARVSGHRLVLAASKASVAFIFLNTNILARENVPNDFCSGMPYFWKRMICNVAFSEVRYEGVQGK